MSLADHFRQGYRDTQLATARAGRGTVAGRGLLQWTANVQGFAGDLRGTGPDAECAVGLAHCVTELDAKRALLNYLGASTKSGQNLVAEVVIDSCRLFFAPAYIFACTSESNWSAAFGYDRTEYFTDHRQVYQDGEYVTKAVTRENILTEWHPQSGQDSQRFVEVAYCGNGLPSAVVGWVESADFSGGAAVTKSQMQQMDTDPSSHEPLASFQRHIDACGLQEVAYGVQDCLQGDRVRDCQWRTHVEAEAVLALVPLCRVSFTVRGEHYNFYMHGRDLSQYTCDTLPDLQDGNKALSRILPTLYAVVLTLVLVFARGEKRDPDGMLWLGTCVFLFFYGCVRQTNYLSRVKTRQNDILQRRLLELEIPGSDDDHGAANVYEEESTGLDRFETTLLPVLLAVAMAITIYRSYHAGPVTLPAPVGAVRPAPIQSATSLPPAAVVPSADTSQAWSPEQASLNEDAGVESAQVKDTIGLLTAEERAQLAARVRQLNENGQQMFAVLIVQSTAPERIDVYANRVANEMALGSAGKSDGILVVLAPGNTPELKRVRIEIGRDLAARLPDSEVAGILTDAVIPAFQRGHYAVGLDTGLIALASYLNLQATAGQAPVSEEKLAAANAPEYDASQQASFSCDNPTRRPEVLICASPGSRGADFDMTQAYNKAQASVIQPEALASAQRAWLRDVRDACTSTACITEATIQRTAQLRKVLDGR